MESGPKKTAQMELIWIGWVVSDSHGLPVIQLEERGVLGNFEFGFM